MPRHHLIDQGFNNVRDIADIVEAWKSQRKGTVGAGGTPIQPDEMNNKVTQCYYVSNSISEINQNLPHFNKMFLQEIWRDIARTEFPSELENDRPPRNLGQKQHGRLKASQWRTTCCFTMLTTLGRLWSQHPEGSNEHMWLKNYLHLVTMVRIAYNHSISYRDIEAFRYHSIQYLQGLRSYHPSSIKPCHHFLLHIPSMMERFGPIRGWWAFPFERFNGQIQHLSTNHKAGTSVTCNIAI
jgi:hypothetical protein